ncbi:MAG: FAD-dependent oxidoreductase [Methylocystaceae bacterium]
MLNNIHLTIDGKPCTGQAGQTILEVAKAYQIDIPTLCHDPRLAPYASCGLCVVEIDGLNRLMRACATAISEGQVIKTQSPRVKASRQTTLELLLSDHQGDCRPPCMAACPAQTDCQGYVGLIANGEYREAIALIKEKLPLPASIGLVCPHPCESACRRGLVEAPIAIADLKAFVGELDLQADEPYIPAQAELSGKKVAVVGAGPAGLTAAYFLARDGYKVTVYDAMPQPGGMLRYGIPEYRLPKKILDQEISLIARLGVDFEMNTRLGDDLDLDTLTQNFDAVFLGLGAWKSSKINCPGEDLPGVLGGIDFLREVAQTGKAEIGNQVAIIGGGNTAMDAARTAKRLGAEQVVVLYRRTRQEMPADDSEIEEAIEEGVQFKLLCAPIDIIGDERVTGIRLQKMQLGEPDASGRCRPEPIPGAEEILNLDTIIAAIGQEVVCPDQPGLSKNKWGNIVADAGTLMTSRQGVFAGGDAVTGPKIAIEAIAQGRRAAQAISAYLDGSDMSAEQPFAVKRDNVTAETFAAVPQQPRSNHALNEPSSRCTNFERVTISLDETAASREASRCLECGCLDYFDCRLIKYSREYQVRPSLILGSRRQEVVRERSALIQRDSEKCILCGLCVRICSEVMGVEALGLVGRGFDTMVKPMFGQDLEPAGCIFCGQCAAVCPTGALVEKQALKKNIALPLNSVTTTCTFCSLGCELVIQSKGNQLVRALPTEKGLLCHRGRAGWYGYNDDRVTTPLIKLNGEFQPASWDDALRYAADLIQAARHKHGAQTVALVASPHLTQEEATALVELGQGVGTENIWALIPSMDRELSQLVDNQDILDIDTLAEAESLYMVGSFDQSAVILARIRNAVKVGVPLWVINSGPTLVDDLTSEKIDAVDISQLFKAACKYLLSTGDVNIDDNTQKEQLAATAVTDAGIQLTQAFLGSQQPWLLIDEFSIDGITTEWIACFCRLLIQKNAVRPHIITVSSEVNREGLAALGIKSGMQLSAATRACLIVGEDPLGMGTWSLETLSNLELLIVMASQMNKTALQADIILPLSLPWETSGHYLGPAGTRRILQQVLTPVTGVTNYDILTGLASAL